MEVNSSIYSFPNLISLGLLLIPLSIYLGFVAGCTNCLNWILFGLFELTVLVFCHSHYGFPTFLPNLFRRTPASEPVKPPTTPVSPTDSAIVVLSDAPADHPSPVMHRPSSPEPMPQMSVVKATTHPYEKELLQAKEKFLSLVQAQNNHQGWDLIVDRGDQLKIWRHTNNEHCFKILGIFEASLITTFDFLNDIESRPKWDEMAETTRVLEILSPSARVQYIRVKAVWPMSARDLVLLAQWQQLSASQWMACTASIEHPAMPVLPGVVRMRAECAGQLCEKHINEGIEHTRVLQIVDGNPGGWIPKSILNMVATKAIPDSFLRVQSIVKTLPPYTQSRYFPVGLDSIPLVNAITNKYIYTPTIEAPTPAPAVALQVDEQLEAPAAVPLPVSRTPVPAQGSPLSPVLRRYLKYTTPALFAMVITLLVLKKRSIPFKAITLNVLQKLVDKVTRFF